MDIKSYKDEYIGHMYNNWEIISTDIYRPNKRGIYFRCRCHCKYCSRNDVSPCEKYVRYNNLRSGATNGCGREYASEIFSTNNPSYKKYNEYDLSGDFGIGHIKTKGKIVDFYFDIEDYDLIKDYTWFISSNGYVYTSLKQNGKVKSFLMHRLIMKVDDCNIQIDHINHIKSDNRKSNLRTCTSFENALNKSISNYLDGSGVYIQDNKWMVRFERNGDRYYGGSFDNYEDALNKRKQIEPDPSSKFQYDNSICEV